MSYPFANSPNGFINRTSMGEVHDIRPGGLNWSRASRGMMREETPIPGAGPVWGPQIFNPADLRHITSLGLPTPRLVPLR